MKYSFNSIALFPLISVVVCILSTIILIIKGKKSYCLTSMISIQVLLMIWALGQILELSADDVEACWSAIIILSLGSTFLGASWTIFTLLYTGVSVKKYVLPVLLPPSISYALLITNKYHYMYYKSFELRKYENGIFYYFFSAQSYIFAIIGLVILIRFCLKQRGFAKQQLYLIIFPPIIPAGTSIIFNFYTIFINNKMQSSFDITPSSFVFSIVFLFSATYESMLPLAMEKVVNSINDAVLVIDEDNKIVNYNPSFSQLFERVIKMGVNGGLFQVTKWMKENAYIDKNSLFIIDSIGKRIDCSISGELIFNETCKKYLLVNMHPIFDHKGEYQGKAVTFTDISQYKNLLSEVEEKNNELSHVNHVLREHMKVVEELAISKERNRLAAELHDTLGHTLTMVIMLAKVGSIKCDKDVMNAKETLQKCIEVAQEGLGKLRHFVSPLYADKLEEKNLILSLEKLVSQSERAGVKVDFSLYGEEIYKSIMLKKSVQELECLNDAIYHACKEAVTNSLRHACADKIDIIIRFEEWKLKVFIVDNGIGCKYIKKGVGLSAMENRIVNLGGTMIIGSDGRKGFNICIDVPL